MYDRVSESVRKSMKVYLEVYDIVRKCVKGNAVCPKVYTEVHESVSEGL